MKEELIDRFVTRLETLGGVAPGSTTDRGALAALRRSLATWPSAPAEAVRVVAPFLTDHVSGWRETVHYLIAGLFALHPCGRSDEPGGRSFGAALREVSGEASPGVERRFLAILGCRNEDLPNHLRHAVSFLRSKEVAIDYRRLMRDLFWWDASEGRVQRRWGRDFWAAPPAESREKSESSTEKENNRVH
jgi:CRISPR type I-E-associated protein CasB/Cse2